MTTTTTATITMLTMTSRTTMKFIMDIDRHSSQKTKWDGIKPIFIRLVAEDRERRRTCLTWCGGLLVKHNEDDASFQQTDLDQLIRTVRTRIELIHAIDWDGSHYILCGDAVFEWTNEQYANSGFDDFLHSYEAFFAITALDSATDLPHSTWYMTTKNCGSGREKLLCPQSPGCLLRRRGVRNGSIEKATLKKWQGGRGVFCLQSTSCPLQCSCASIGCRCIARQWQNKVATLGQNHYLKGAQSNNGPACVVVQKQRKATINRLSVVARWQCLWRQLLPCSKTAIATKWLQEENQSAVIATIHRLSIKAEWCQHRLSPSNETVMLAFKVKQSWKGQQSTC